MNRHSMSRAAVSLLGPLLVLALLAACGPRTGDLGGVATQPPTAGASADVPTPVPTSGPTAPSGSPGASPAPTDAGTTTVRAYFFLGSFTGDAGLVPVLRTVPKTQAVGAAAMAALLGGPNQAEMSARPAMYTVVPEGTRFLGLRIENGIAIVNLSREFESGGGSASVLGRLGQVVYTLTQFPTVTGVRLELDGQPVTVFSGEGVVLDAPLTRADYTDFLPSVWVDGPAWGSALGNPARITGLANTFEASFEIEILDAGGTVLASQHAMATCGSGCWGTFDVTIPYTVVTSVPTTLQGTLRVFERSAQDGSRIHVVEYPVTLR
jgi:hypothetical protein